MRDLKTLFGCYTELSRLMMQPRTDEVNTMIDMVEFQIEQIKTLEAVQRLKRELGRELQRHGIATA